MRGEIGEPGSKATLLTTRGRALGTGVILVAHMKSARGSTLGARLVASVKDLRGGNIEDDFDLTETFDHLRRHGHFKNLTMAMVRKADWEARRLLKEEARVSDMLVRAQAELDAMRAATGDGPAADDGGWECSEGDTSGADCRSTGDGLREATARQPAYFWIEAADKLGSRRTTGGDIFCVAIRGPSQVQSLAC